MSNVNNTLKNKLSQKLFACYIDVTINIFGIFLSSIAFVVFLSPKFKENMYNYIRIEIISTIFTLLLYSFRATYYCTDTVLSTYGYEIIYIFFRYLRYVFEMNTTLMAILSSLCFYFVISNLENAKFNFISKTSYKLIISVIFVLNILIFLYLLFESDIVEYFDNDFKNQSTLFENRPKLFYLKTSYFARTLYHQIFEILAFLIENIICVLVLIIINLLIFMRLRKFMKNKVNIKRNASNQAIMNKNMDRTKRSIRLMIFAGNLTLIISRLPVTIDFIVKDILGYQTPKNSFYDYAHQLIFTFISFSFSIKFILYYSTNILFRKTFNNYVCLFLKSIKLMK